MDIYLVRHGLTHENVKNIVSGHIEATLNEEGIRQAIEAGMQLKDKKIDVIYVSDLKRTRHTAEHISKHHGKAEVIYTPVLREYKYGRFEGMVRTEEIKKELSDLIYTRKKGDRDGIETVAQAHVRMKAFISELKKRHKDHTVILVTHGGVSRIITAILSGVPKGKIKDMERMNNAEIRHFKV